MNKKSTKKKNLDSLAARKRKNESISHYQEKMLRIRPVTPQNESIDDANVESENEYTSFTTQLRDATKTVRDYYSTVPETIKAKMKSDTKENIINVREKIIDSTIVTDQTRTTILNEIHNESSSLQENIEEKNFDSEKENIPLSTKKIIVHSSTSITKEEAISQLWGFDPCKKDISSNIPPIHMQPICTSQSSGCSCLSAIINVPYTTTSPKQTITTDKPIALEKHLPFKDCEDETSSIPDVNCIIPVSEIEHTTKQLSSDSDDDKLTRSVLKEPSITLASQTEDIMTLTVPDGQSSFENDNDESFSILKEPVEPAIEDLMTPTTPTRHLSFENHHEENFSVLNEPEPVLVCETENLMVKSIPLGSPPVNIYDEEILLQNETPETNKKKSDSQIMYLPLQNDIDMDGIKAATIENAILENDQVSKSSTTPVPHHCRISKRRKSHNKAYIDFLSDDGDFSPGSSDKWSAGCESDSSDNGKKKRKNRTKKVKDIAETSISKRRIKLKNKSKFRKEQKDAGKSYETRISGYLKEEKSMQENPCVQDKCARGCYAIPETRRKALFEYFWSLDVQRRRDWIVRCVRICHIKRKKTKLDESRRNVTYEYVINDGEGFKQVCQKFLIKTLSITQKYILYTITNANEGMASKDRRHSNVPVKYSLETKNYAKEYIESLPAVPSHYCRARTNRMYLPQEFKNTTNLYRMYSTYCIANAQEKLSEKLFTKMFKEEYNIGFHIPKKDKCGRCVQAQNKDLSEIEQIQLNEHIEEKKGSYKRFKIHQNLRTKDTVTVSFDLQKVLNTPHGENMLLYYSRKYSVFNLTFYESESQEGFCYTWGECDGKRGGNEIATGIYMYLQEVDHRPIKNVLLYCDSCTGQNKNKVTLSAIYYFLKSSRNVEVVQLNFLLPGHSYMPVDSMHAVIEREVAKLIVWSPSQWPTYMESSRKRPKPYKVTVLEHEDFKDWEPVTNNLNAEALKQIKFKTVRIITLKKKDLKKIEVKYSMKEGSEKHIITIEKTKRSKKGKGIGKGKSKVKNIVNEEENNLHLKPLYNNRLPISAVKYKDLKRLCDNGAIPKRFHNEYINLPFLENVVDVLPETDEDDTVDIE